MVASVEQCRRHATGAASAISSFSDDGVVQTVLKELRKVDENARTGAKPPLVSLKFDTCTTRNVFLLYSSLKKVLFISGF